jgi:hypothetical protein
MSATIGWVDSALSANPPKRGQTSKVAGSQVREFAQNWEKATGDGDGSIYYLAALPADAVLTGIKLNADALTGCTDVDLGIYKLNDDGTIVDTAKSDGSSAADILVNGWDPHSGAGMGSDKDGMADLDISNLGVKLWNLLGFTDPKLKNEVYILGLRLNTAGSAAGTLAIRGRFAQG